MVELPLLLLDHHLPSDVVKLVIRVVALQQSHLIVTFLDLVPNILRIF